MTPCEAFLQEILERPEDDLPRLIFADWLEDHGDPDRAAFIRLQIDRYRGRCTEPDRARRHAAELLSRNWADWIGPLAPVLSGSARHQKRLILGHGQQAVDHALEQFPRGFVQSLNLDSGVFVKYAEEIYRHAALTRLQLHESASQAARLAKCPQLKWLQSLEFADYWRDPLDAAGMAALARSPHLTRLNSLILVRNYLGDTGLQELAQAPWLRTVRRLELQDNGISVRGVAALTDSSYLQSIQLLLLDRNTLNDDAMVILSRAEWIQHLRHLSVLGTGVTRVGVERLRRAAPLLSVAFPGGTLSPRWAR